MLNGFWEGKCGTKQKVQEEREVWDKEMQKGKEVHYYYLVDDFTGVMGGKGIGM